MSDINKHYAVGPDRDPVADAPALTSLRSRSPGQIGHGKYKKQKELNLQWVEECAEDSSVTGEPLTLNW